MKWSAQMVMEYMQNASGPGFESQVPHFSQYYFLLDNLAHSHTKGPPWDFFIQPATCLKIRSNGHPGGNTMSHSQTCNTGSHKSMWTSSFLGPDLTICPDLTFSRALYFYYLSY